MTCEPRIIKEKRDNKKKGTPPGQQIVLAAPIEIKGSLGR